MLFDLAVFAVALVFGMWAKGLIDDCYLVNKSDRFCRTPVNLRGEFYYIVPEQDYLRHYAVSPKWEEAYCKLPPAGWYCTRAKGHEGPCAAHQVKAT